MKSLSETWFADGYIDFELKKYTLLAYLKEIHFHFDQKKLYPQLADIIFHYNNLVSFRENKKFLQEQFPKKLSGVQVEKLQLLYQQMMEDDELMTELESIINYASSKMRNTITNGAELYETVEKNMSISPVGIIPLKQHEGYFFLMDTGVNTKVYEYRLSIYEKHDEKYRSIQTEYVDTWYRSISQTVEHIKSELIKKRTALPNPAVYIIETNSNWPVDETLLPVAKRSLVRYITTNAA